MKSMATSLPTNLSTEEEQDLSDTLKELKEVHRALLLQAIQTQRLRNIIKHLERRVASFHCTAVVSGRTTGFIIGEWVQITNSLRDEFGTVGSVVKISVNNSFIYIKSYSTGAIFKRSPRHLRRLPSQEALQLIFPNP